MHKADAIRAAAIKSAIHETKVFVCFVENLNQYSREYWYTVSPKAIGIVVSVFVEGIPHQVAEKV